MGSRGPLPGQGGRPVNGSQRRTAKTIRPNGFPATGRVVMPATLLRNPVAADFWKRHAAGLIADGRLSADKAEAFGMACMLHAEIEEHLEVIRREGWTIITGSGYQQPHPRVAIVNRNRVLLTKLMVEFGMTHAAAIRAPVAEQPPEAENPLHRFGITS